jgi:diguanylate cyclase (GGDEF)-like protein
MLNKNIELITSKVFNKIKNFKILLPEKYNEIFLSTAYELNIDKNDILDINHVDRTLFHQFETLENNTEAAISAININDTKELEKIKKEIVTLKEEIVNLRESVYEDALTKTFNRKYLIHKILNDKNNFINSGILVIVDLNNLKKINDNIGHNIGDKVIVLLAEELKKISKEVIRYGGDEFLLFFNNEGDVKKIYNKLKNLRENLLKKTIKTSVSNFKITFSFGVIKVNKNDWFEEILEDVDKKMYIDKIKFKSTFKV